MILLPSWTSLARTLLLAALCLAAPQAKADWLVSWPAVPDYVSGGYAPFDYGYAIISWECSDGEYEEYYNDWGAAHYWFLCDWDLLRGEAWGYANLGQPGAESGALVVNWSLSVNHLMLGYWNCDDASFLAADIQVSPGWSC